MGWLVALAVLVLLAILPLSVRADYNAAGLGLWVGVWKLRLQLIPGRKKEKPKKEEGSGKAPRQAKGASAPKESKKGGTLQDLMPWIRLALDFLGDFKGKLRIDRLDANVILASSDPADLGILYGRCWEALGNLWPRLERFFVIKRRNVQLQCDFEGDAIRIDARVEISLTLGRLLSLVFRYGIRALKQLFTMKNKKGGAVNEP